MILFNFNELGRVMMVKVVVAVAALSIATVFIHIRVDGRR
jgi:hypothetical protein